MPPNQNILFDLDGTLTDPREGIVRCIQHALTTLGREAPPAHELERFIGPPLGNTFGTLLGSNEPTVIEAAISAYRSRFTTLGIFENHVYPGIHDALEGLRIAGRGLFLVTVKPQVFAQRIVRHFGLAPHLRAIYAPDLGDTFPDKASLVRKALETENLDPASATMVGDRADDVVAARRNSVSAIAVTWGYGSRAELESAAPDFMVGSVPELLACLDAP